MNDVIFCHKLYDDLMKIYKDTSMYRITTYKDNPYKSQIECIPAGLNELVDKITALTSVSSYVQLELRNPVFILELEVYTKKTGECSLEIYIYSDIKTVYYNLPSKNWHLKTGCNKKKIIVFSEKDIYSMRNMNGKYYPTNFKDLRIFPKELVSVLMPHFTETHIWKDFIADDFFPPVKLNELCLYHNKKDYLQKIFKLSLPKSINKLSLNQSYAICCALKYIKPEQQQIIFSLKFDFDMEYNIDKRKRKSIAADYLKRLLFERLVDIKISIVNDYIDFSLQQSRPIDMLVGKGKVISLHNEIAEEIIRKSNQCSKIIIPETPLKYLKLPKEFVLIKTQKALIDEGKINHNCVGGYGKKITSGKCVIYSANIRDEHLTIEIKFRKVKNEYKFYIAQCYKACNQPCSPDTLEYVKKCLAECTDKAVRKYINSTINQAGISRHHEKA